MSKLLGVDLGTSGCKALLIEGSGTVLAQASAGYPLSMPHPLWSEQDPYQWFSAVQRCISEVGGLDGVSAIGVAGQMHGAVFLDQQGESVRPAILWNDQRTAAECAEIESLLTSERVREVTCNPPLTGFQLPKLLWLRRHEPDNFSKVAKVLLPKDYIRYRLTGAYATEPSDASGTGIFDVPERRWSKEFMDALRLPPDLFPPCFDSQEVTGVTPSGTPLVGGAGDQAAAAVGTGAVREGIVSVSLGTSGVVFSALDKPKVESEGALHTFCHANGRWHAMGVMLACGGALSWFQQAFGANRPFDEIAKEAEKAEAGCMGLTFLPYLSGERSPHNDPDARAAWLGITASHGFAEMARAVFEGVSFGLADSMDRLLGLGVTCEEVRVTGGGARSGFWVQMLADVLERPCSVLACDEGPAFGAALLAGVGIGLWRSVEEASAATVRTQKTFVPSGVNYREALNLYRQMYPRLRGVWRT